MFNVLRFSLACLAPVDRENKKHNLNIHKQPAESMQLSGISLGLEGMQLPHHVSEVYRLVG